jgi:hypothetical protein
MERQDDTGAFNQDTEGSRAVEYARMMDRCDDLEGNIHHETQGQDGKILSIYAGVTL